MTFFRYLAIVILFSSCSSPKAIFKIDKESNQAPASVRFINESQKALKYQWDFGDGKTSEETNPEHKYTLSGKYTITLKAIKNKSVSKSHQEIIIDPPHHCLIEMQTTAGSMIIQLYDETPRHRDNFIKLAEEGFYEGLLFHRVIRGFMIQGGDPDSKGAPAGNRLGSGGPKYKIPAEFNDTLVHIKGALAAARQGDGVNPRKESSGSQFYIVQGSPVSGKQLESFELQKGIKYSPQQKQILSATGGTPALDKEYTVFGQVMKGLEIIDEIAAQQTDEADRPIKDVKILSVKIIK